MSEKPQTTQEDGQEDLLEQIFTQGLEKVKTPTQTAATEESPPEAKPAAPKQENGAAAPSADRKNRRSAAYLYLLILFVAAFLMLLLAYFVQQRSSENTITDLQESMNLSRELLEQISALEERNDALSNALSQMQVLYESKCTEIERQSDTYVAFLAEHYAALADLNEKLYSWDSFWQLESYYQAENYLLCGVILVQQTQVFNNFTYSTPRVVQKRYDEIVRAVVNAGILDEDYEQHLEDYSWMLEVLF